MCEFPGMLKPMLGGATPMPIPIIGLNILVRGSIAIPECRSSLSSSFNRIGLFITFPSSIAFLASLLLLSLLLVSSSTKGLTASLTIPSWLRLLLCPAFLPINADVVPVAPVRPRLLPRPPTSDSISLPSLGVIGAPLPLLESPVELAGLFLLVPELDANGFGGIELFVGESGILEINAVDFGLEDVANFDDDVKAIVFTPVAVFDFVRDGFFVDNGCAGIMESKVDDLLRAGAAVGASVEDAGDPNLDGTSCFG